jgi:hypothetical protein
MLKLEELEKQRGILHENTRIEREAFEPPERQANIYQATATAKLNESIE